MTLALAVAEFWKQMLPVLVMMLLPGEGRLRRYGKLVGRPGVGVVGHVDEAAHRRWGVHELGRVSGEEREVRVAGIGRADDMTRELE